MKIVIVDYGMGNLDSVKRAFEECKANPVVSDDPDSLKSAQKIVLPGVGSFCNGMDNLESRGWIPAIKEEAGNNKIPLLGICLGMQILATKGYEGGEREGLDLIPGEIVKLIPLQKDERVPHIGWNEVAVIRENPLFKNIINSSDFYFVHSYHFLPRKEDHVIAKTPYCGGFVSAVLKDNIFGVQFHPEKSQFPGMKLISNFLDY